MENKNKLGQVTLFIIVGIIIVALIILFFMLKPEKTPNTGGKPDENLESFLDLCLKLEKQLIQL